MSTLLLVDDDGDDVELALLGFKEAGFEHDVEILRDGAQALEYLQDAKRRGKLPAAVLLDLKMPRVDGLGVLRSMKDDPRLKTIPVAILTSSGHERDRQEALRLGVARYLLKPADLDDYGPIVREIRELMA